MGLWAIAAIGAFFVKGLCGFAQTLVFTSVRTLFPYTTLSDLWC